MYRFGDAACCIPIFMRFYGDSPYSLGVGPVISNIFLKLFQTIIHHQILGEIRFLQYGNGMVQVGDIRSITVSYTHLDVYKRQALPGR